ncbi:MAG TPA: NAD(P)H-quinone oxidoreductase [Steroidobacteraceae bacterium]|nr:NAD(P)H-quinone oxidoreductase [Steroidobacteraceae bacterium]
MRQIAYGPGDSADSLRVVEAPAPVPGEGEVLITVDYAGVNRPDLLQRSGKYPPPPDASPVLGLEVAGRVAALGPQAGPWKVGDAVCALTPGGGYAELCKVPMGQVLPVPQGVTLEQAAGIPETWFTVWANLVELGRLSAGEQLLVHGGSSGIGLAAIELAKLRGAQCLVTVGDDDKAKFCRDFGAHAAINYRSEDFVARVRELTAGEGVDVVLDMVGGDYIPKNLSVLRRDGRLVLIAFQRGSRVDLDLSPVMRNRLVVTGSTMRPRTVVEKTRIRDALQREVWPEFAAGRVRTHVHSTFPLSQAAEAHRLMESGRHVGKILLRVRP